MARSSRYSPEFRVRTVRMVREHAAAYPSQWAAIESIPVKLGCTSETLRQWVRQTERDAGRVDWFNTGCMLEPIGGRFRNGLGPSGVRVL
jgi:hypothetical protein